MVVTCFKVLYRHLWRDEYLRSPSQDLNSYPLEYSVVELSTIPLRLKFKFPVNLFCTLFWFWYLYNADTMSRRNSSRYSDWLTGWIIGVREFDSRRRGVAGNCSLFHRVQPGFWAHPASCAMGTGGSFFGGKADGA
jgi:hypothetical protein